MHNCLVIDHEFLQDEFDKIYNKLDRIESLFQKLDSRVTKLEEKNIQKEIVRFNLQENGKNTLAIISFYIHFHFKYKSCLAFVVYYRGTRAFCVIWLHW